MNIKAAVKPIFTIFLTLLAYVLIMKSVGGPNTNPPQLASEIPLMMLMCVLFGLPLRQFKLRWVIACIPVLALYLFIDIYDVAFNRVFKWSELHEIPEMIDVLPLFDLVLLWIPALLPLAIYSAVIAPKRIAWLALPLAIVFSTYTWLQSAPQSYIATYLAVSKPVIPQNESRTVRNNGRVLTTLFYEASRQNVLSSLSLMANKPLNQFEHYQTNVSTLQELAPNRNIHIIVLESYIDPSNFKGIKFTQPIEPADFKWLSPYKDYSISPVFGGHTPQAEFELLCGIPAQSKYSSIEFNLFTGAKVSCLPQWLQAIGYNTIASHAHKTTFFNRKKAYPGLGFEEIYFPIEYSGNPSTYMKRNTSIPNGLMFDGDLFEQNLAFIEKKLESQQPILNYVLGVYGHAPHLIDESRFPLKVEASIDDTLIQKITNEYTYRTEALNSYLQSLIKIDPTSLILVISDHLPPLDGMTGIYKEFGYLDTMPKPMYQNLLYFIDQGKPTTFDGTHHFQLSDFILDKLTAGRYCKALVCNYTHAKVSENANERYQQIMAQAVSDRQSINTPNLTSAVDRP